jgi:tryptophan synthase alpha chain
MIAPNTKLKRMKEIAREAEGFIYYVTSTGVTGERKELPTDIKQKIEKIHKLSGLPIFAGFGISKPEHVTMLKKDVQGIIVGSLNHTIIQEFGKTSSLKLKEITSNFLQELKK